MLGTDWDTSSDSFCLFPLSLGQRRMEGVNLSGFGYYSGPPRQLNVPPPFDSHRTMGLEVIIPPGTPTLVCLY